MMGYKIFNSDWRCRDTQYAVGETTRVEGEIVLCRNGLHFCERAVDCTNYYTALPTNRYAEVRADGVVITHVDKSATNALHVVREISYQEFLKLCTRTTETYHPNGVQKSMYSFIGGYLYGTSKEWYENGNIKMVSNYIQDHLCHRIVWHPNGNKARATKYSNGRRHGCETLWNKHGFKRAEIVYDMDLVQSHTNFNDAGEVVAVLPY